MPRTSAETAVRTYLTALRDPSSLRDEENVAALQSQLESASDHLERLRLRQQLLDLESPSIGRYEEDFITHAKAWADQEGITPSAFEAEGVPAGVLRKAGLAARRGRSGRGGTRRRVTVDQVRGAIPRGTFTIKTLQDKSGASPAVVRRVVADELAAGRLKDQGPDPDHRGPGRAATLYKKAR
ncbi:MAG: hypothetical protein GEU74_00705 [Nitriliruptorales bacterium]|nr:hypothetical protein [Nitriliruptorales bacterium]